MDGETRQRIRVERDRLVRRNLSRLRRWDGVTVEGSQRPSNWPPLIVIERNGTIKETA